MGKSAHRELQDAAQRAADKAREFALIEVLGWLVSLNANPAFAEVERAFRDNWFETVTTGGRDE